MPPSQGDVGEHPGTDGTAELLRLSQSETPYQHDYGYNRGGKRVGNGVEADFPLQEGKKTAVVLLRFLGRKAGGCFYLILS